MIASECAVWFTSAGGCSNSQGCTQCRYVDHGRCHCAGPRVKSRRAVRVPSMLYTLSINVLSEFTVVYRTLLMTADHCRCRQAFDEHAIVHSKALPMSRSKAPNIAQQSHVNRDTFSRYFQFACPSKAIRPHQVLSLDFTHAISSRRGRCWR